MQLATPVFSLIPSPSHTSRQEVNLQFAMNCNVRSATEAATFCQFILFSTLLEMGTKYGSKIKIFQLSRLLNS